MAPLEDVDDETLEPLLAASTTPVIIEFWAPWCGPCKMLDAPLRRIADELRDRLRIVKVNIAEAPGLGERYEVKATPTFVLVSHGRPLDRKSGALPTAVLRDWARAAAS